MQGGVEPADATEVTGGQKGHDVQQEFGGEVHERKLPRALVPDACCSILLSSFGYRI